MEGILLVARSVLDWDPDVDLDQNEWPVDHPRRLLAGTQIADGERLLHMRTTGDMDKMKKKGSLQIFAKHDDVAYNFGSNTWSTDEVHKIGILDIRILNADRNDENILIKKIDKDDLQKNEKKYELIPIDHGLSLPDSFTICRDNVIWMDWK